MSYINLKNIAAPKVIKFFLNAFICFFNVIILIKFIVFLKLHFQMQMQNTDLYDRNPRVFPVAIYLCFFLGLSLMVPPVISRVIQEKFTGAKVRLISDTTYNISICNSNYLSNYFFYHFQEMMLMMGVKKWQLWIAKFIDSFFFQFITISGMVLFVYIPLKQDSNVLKVSPFIFLSVVLYGLISVILFLFFLSNFFKKRK